MFKSVTELEHFYQECPHLALNEFDLSFDLCQFSDIEEQSNFNLTLSLNEDIYFKWSDILNTVVMASKVDFALPVTPLTA